MDLRVTRVRKIAADGRHNAFTGITSAHGQTVVTFRSAVSHMSMDGGISLLHAPDLMHWQAAAPLHQAGLDLRDPKPAWFAGQLWVYCGARLPDKTLTSWRIPVSDNFVMGASEPLQGLPAGRWLWHVRPHEGLLYGTAYGPAPQGKAHAVSLHVSSDGRRWDTLTEFPIPGNEVFLDFDADGTLWALVRDDSLGSVPTLCRAEPPYTRFDRVMRLPMRLQGPMLKRLDGGCVIVCRQWNRPAMRQVRTDMFWLQDGHEVEHLCTLPSGGDTSYAGWLDTGPGQAALVYYSSHEHAMDTPHQVPENAAGDPEAGHAADIYLAEISYA